MSAGNKADGDVALAELANAIANKAIEQVNGRDTKDRIRLLLVFFAGADPCS